MNEALTDASGTRSSRSRRAPRRWGAAARVWVYHAVLEHGVRTYEEFTAWRAGSPLDQLTSWRPGPGSGGDAAR
ncbi:hypothetical protein NKH77_27500 [Streptomyces sp. M19]